MAVETFPPIESLQCFSEAARLLNFRAAAHRVALTPAALGQRIRTLERQLGTRLFQRTTRHVSLTPAGLALVPHAERALAAARDCVRTARGEIGPPPVEITLGTRHELGLSWILPLLPRLRAARPALTIHLYFGSGPDLLHRLRAQEVDCLVTSARIGDLRLAGIELHEERYEFVARPSLLKRRPLAGPADAAQHALVDTNADLPLFRYFREAPGGSDFHFGRVLRVGTTAAVRRLVVRGEGVGVLPLHQIAADLRARRLVRIFPKVTPLSDWFRLVFRIDDPLRSVYEAVAAEMRKAPLR